MPNPVRRTCDKTVVTLMVLLLLMGLVTLFSATYYQKAATGDALAAVKKQLIGVALGAAACVTLSRVPYRVFRRPKVTLLLLTASALMLILVIIPGIGVSINGSRRWLNIFGLSMQPSEFAKYAMVVFMAGALDRRGEAIDRLFTGIIPLLVVPGVMFLLILEQPNLSTGGSILICALVMLFAAGIAKAAYRAAGHRRADRRRVLRMERAVSTGAAALLPRPVRQDERRGLSALAIADCARLGRAVRHGAGAGAGRNSRICLIRNRTSFSPIVGRGFRADRLPDGDCVVRAVCAVRGFACRWPAGISFGCLLGAGITSMIGLQAFINMGVVTGMLPTTGLPLPFFSAGGTSVSVMMAAVGVLLSISRENGARIVEPTDQQSGGRA